MLPSVITRRFAPPWTIEEHAESFIVKDANGQALGHFFISTMNRNGPRARQHRCVRAVTPRAQKGRDAICAY